MKKILPLLLTSLMSALLALAGYHFFIGPRVIVQDIPNAHTQYTRLNESMPEGMHSAYPDKSSYAEPSGYISAAPTSFSKAAEKATIAVVNIKASQTRTLDWWGYSNRGSASGSGVIVSADGFIVTNNHVVEDGDQFDVTLFDKREYKAKLIGTDPSTDLAVLKVQPEVPLPFVSFGNSDSLRIGEWVLAVGNPFNLESTVTAGIVSAKGRNIDILEDDYSIESFIQTDAAVNPGNSGGALVNTNGDLIGINTAIITRSGRYEGYSFAVPSRLVQKVIHDLRDYGAVQRGILGVGISDITSRQARTLGLSAVEGVYITRITPDGGAEEAGLQRGDVILSIDDKKVSSVPELQETVARYRPGNILKVEFFRDGKTLHAPVTLRNQYNTTELPTNIADESLMEDLGMDVRNLKREEIRRIGSDGVYVVSIERGSEIEHTKMEPGYIITHLNSERIYSVKDLLEALHKTRGEVMLEGIYENFEDEYYYVFYK